MMEEVDSEMLREMLAWLGRGLDLEADTPENDLPEEVELNEADCIFLQENGIALPW